MLLPILKMHFPPVLLCVDDTVIRKEAERRSEKLQTSLSPSVESGTAATAELESGDHHSDHRKWSTTY